jgi:hypothetical protein
MVNLSAALKTSGLVQAEYAGAALAVGWKLNSYPEPVRCNELLPIYSIRHQHLLRQESDYAKQLATSVEEFVVRLNDNITGTGYWMDVRGPDLHHFLIFALAGPHLIIGCFRVIDASKESLDRANSAF